MKWRATKTTLCLTACAIACYALSWTGVAIGLGILGMLFEAASELNSMRDDALQKRKSDEGEGGSERENW
jgi:hypothetical protein